MIPEAEPCLQNSQCDQQPGAPASLATSGSQSPLIEPGGAPTEEASELNIQSRVTDQKLNNPSPGELNIQFPEAPPGELNIQSPQGWSYGSGGRTAANTDSINQCADSDSRRSFTGGNDYGSAEAATPIPSEKPNIQSASGPGKLNIQSETGRVIELAPFREKLNDQGMEYDKKLWKRSRERPGYLIKRIKGYDIVENSKYGVSYVWVYQRTPKLKTSSDSSLHEHAGFFTWRAMERMGRAVKEKLHEHSDTFSRDGVRSS